MPRPVISPACFPLLASPTYHYVATYVNTFIVATLKVGFCAVRKTRARIDCIRLPGLQESGNQSGKKKTGITYVGWVSSWWLGTYDSVKYARAQQIQLA